MQFNEFKDPFQLKRLLWPKVTFYDKQVQVVQSVWDNDETVVTAGNMLGKDFVAAFIVLAAFLTRHPCRIVTTSAKADHLRVLWGEIGWYIQESRLPLTVDRGGPLIVNHQELHRMIRGVRCPLSYVTAMVASPDTIASFQGHHIKQTGDSIWRTMFVSDESSSVPDAYYRMAKTWANRVFAFGNPWPCDNFFKHAVKGKPGTKDRGGNRPRPDGPGYWRRVIRIRAQDSPNVRMGLAQIAAGLQPTDEMLVPGVKRYSEYIKNLAEWDEEQICVSLGGDFYEAPAVLMFPAQMRDAAKRYADEIRGMRRVAKAVGCDPGEGGANTAMVAVDEHGVVDRQSRKTPNTAHIGPELIEFARHHGVPDEMWVLDRGGGGTQIADQLRDQGYEGVRTVPFGGAVSEDPVWGRQDIPTRIEERERRYSFVDKRSQLYGELMELLEGGKFAIGAEFDDIHEQLAPIPKRRDGEGRLRLPPKRGKPGSHEPSLIDLIGHSPDEADALVLAVHGMLHEPEVVWAGPV